MPARTRPRDGQMRFPHSLVTNRLASKRTALVTAIVALIGCCAAAVPALAAGRHGDGHSRLACLDTADARHENVEVGASHLGLGVNPLAVSVVWDRLARQEGQWRPYLGLDRALAGA